MDGSDHPSLVEQLLSSPPAWIDTPVVEFHQDKPIHKTLAVELLLGSLPEWTDPSRLSSSECVIRRERNLVCYEDLKTIGKNLREKLEKRKKQLEDWDLPLFVLFCYHIPLHLTENDWFSLLFDDIGILGVTKCHLELSNNQSSKVCWLYFLSDEWCELAAFHLVQLVEQGESLPFEFSFSLPKNDDIVQWKTQTSKKRKRASKLQSSLATAHDLGLVSNTLFFEYVEADMNLDHFRKILINTTSGVTDVRITEPLLRKRPGRKCPSGLIETSRLGWVTYASEPLLLNALTRLKSMNLEELGLSVPKIDETASKQKQHPGSFLSPRQKRSQVSALKSGGKKITFIYEK